MLSSWSYYFGSVASWASEGLIVTVIVPTATAAAAVIAAIAAARSARTANQARDDLGKADRERCLREVSLLAYKINTTNHDPDSTTSRPHPTKFH